MERFQEICCVVLLQAVGGDAVCEHCVINLLVFFFFRLHSCTQLLLAFLKVAQDDCHFSQLRNTKVAYDYSRSFFVIKV